MAGIASSIVFLCLPGLIRFAQEARPTGLLLAAAAIAWWTFELWMRPGASGRSPRRRRIALGTLLTVALLAIALSSLFGLLQWGAMGIGVLLSTAQAETRGGWIHEKLKRLIPLFSAAVVGGLPLAHIARMGAGPAAGASPTTEILWNNLPSVPFTNRFSVEPWMVAILAGLASLTVANGRGGASRLIWVWFLVPLAGGIAAGLLHPPFVRDRYWMPLILPMGILASVGVIAISQLLTRVRPTSAGQSPAVVIPAVLVATLALGTLPGAAEARSRTGHGADMAPVIKQVRALQKKHPESLIMIDGNGASFYFASPAPDLFEENLLLEPDPDSVNVWRATVPTDQREDILAGADSVIWVHWWKYPPAATFKVLPDQLTAAGLHKMHKERLGTHWDVSFYSRD